MKTNSLAKRLRIGITMLLVISTSLLLFSFTAKRFTEDFLQQLGITKISADEKISNSILGGYLDQYGLRNAKNIAVGNRAAVVKDLLTYTKQYVSSPAFVKEYTQLRDNNKPKPVTIETPEEMRTGIIDRYKKSIAETDANMKKADASMKKIFEPILVSLKQQLADAEDPNNKMMANYKKNYPETLKSIEASNKQSLQEWEEKYPVNQLRFVKERLKQFMEETSNIDFAAQLTEKNNRKYFVNPTYEHKSNRWKMAYRAGKEVVEPARTFVQGWIDEIK